MAAAVPFALQAGTALAGSLFGKKTSGPNPTQQAGMTGATTSADALTKMSAATTQKGDALSGQASTLTGQGSGYLGNAADYYKNILSGNRFGMRQALQPEQKSILDYYRGGASTIANGMRGGARDDALAKLNQQKVGQLTSLIPSARAGAASAVGNLGGTALGAGANLYGQAGNMYGMAGGQQANAGNIYGNLFNQGAQIDKQTSQGGNAWGNLLYGAAQALPWGKSGGSSGASGSSAMFSPSFFGLPS